MFEPMVQLPKRGAVPKRRGRLRRFVLVSSFATAVFFGVVLLRRFVEAPWSFGFDGRSTLTGTWEGSRRAGQGAEYRLLLDLAYSSSDVASDRYGASDNLLGEARLCSPTGDVWVYRLTGRANRAGDKISLHFGTPADGPRMPTPGATTARWDGEEQLTIAGGYNPLMPDGTFVANRVVSSDDPDDSFAPATLARSDRETFEQACRALRRMPESGGPR